MSFGSHNQRTDRRRPDAKHTFVEQIEVDGQLGRKLTTQTRRCPCGTATPFRLH
jgi:hypothetical protein